jgi:hypothetical protein
MKWQIDAVFCHGSARDFGESGKPDGVTIIKPPSPIG